MGQKNSTDRLPEEIRKQVYAMLKDPAMTQKKIVEVINTKMGKKAVSRSSICRLATHVRQQKEKDNSNSGKALVRIATALERIADHLEQPYPS
jgi:RNase P protein component